MLGATWAKFGHLQGSLAGQRDLGDLAEGLAGRGRGSIGPQVVAPSMSEDAGGHTTGGFAFGSAASLALLKHASLTPKFSPSPKTR